ncbi:MAG: MarR family transcriptional regulator [Pseudomonadota bacterium]|nr:MarR family transcriptional regulator [Pseudomonadota bacterium]
MQRFGLSRAKWDVILALDTPDSEGLTQRDLARQCGVEPPTMASLLDRMENEGWVVRRVCSGDRRAKRTELTPKARAIRAEIRALSMAVEQEVFANLPAATYGDIQRGLMQLRDALEKSAQGNREQEVE